MKSILVETDIIVEFLTAPEGHIPLLRRLLQSATCFSTFIQAAEIYSAVRGDEERRAVERALFGLKILGASSRYAKTIGDVLSSSRTSEQRHRAAIVAAMAIEARLPIVTEAYIDMFSAIPGLVVVPASAFQDVHDPEALDALLGSTS